MMASSIELQAYQVFINEINSINRQIKLIKEKSEDSMTHSQLLETKSYLTRRISEIRQKI
jgi:hypothetical protein